MNDLTSVTDEELQRLVANFEGRRMESPWFQMVESALRELQDRRAQLDEMSKSIAAQIEAGGSG